MPTFYQDLLEIVAYIKFQLYNPVAAEHLVDDMEQAILERAKAPEPFAPYRFPRNPARPFHYISVKNFFVFYTVDGDIMEVGSIQYNRRDLGTFGT